MNYKAELMKKLNLLKNTNFKIKSYGEKSKI